MNSKKLKKEIYKKTPNILFIIALFGVLAALSPNLLSAFKSINIDKKMIAGMIKCIIQNTIGLPPHPYTANNRPSD